MKSCPRCGASNPAENKFCGNCGTLLVEAPAAAAPSWLHEPSISTANAPANEQELPAWLTELGIEDEPTTSAETVQAPDWLAQLQQEMPAAAPVQNTTSELPDWLREIETMPPATAQAVTAPATEELPAWLRDFDEPQPAPVAADRSQSATGEELPPWLREDEPQQAPSAPVAAATDDLPSWMSANGAAPSDATAPAPPDELPSWLRENETPVAFAGAETSSAESPVWFQADHAPQPPALTSADELPSWLRADDVAAPEAALPRDTKETPSWLHENVAEYIPPPSATEGEAQTGSANLDVPVPDWSSEFGAPSPTQPEAELPAWLAEAAGEPTIAQPPSTDAPSWLMEESPTAAASSEALAHPEPALPAWLIESNAASASSANKNAPAWLTSPNEAQPPAVDPGTTEELPAWLRDDTIASEAAATTPVDDLPSWLQTTDEPAPPPSGTGVPDWLALPDQPDAEPGAARIYESSVPNDELPAWLQADAEAASAEPTASVYDVPAQGFPASAAVDQGNAARIYEAPAAPSRTDQSDQAPTGAETVQFPAWLSDAETPAARTTQPSDAELPAWLSGIAPEETTPSQATAQLPTWLDEPQQPSAPAKPDEPQSELVSGLDLPAWLRDGSDAPAPVAPAAQTAPAWLQQVAPETEAAPPAPPVVEAAPPAPRVVRSPERIASMQLLQQLRDEPAPEPVPQPKAAPRAWLMPLLLFLIAAALVAALVFVLLNNRLLDFGVAPAAPVVPNVVQTVQKLPANRPVLIAYEWNAQRAAELRPLEDAVIGQLAERTDVPLVFLSTDPQGALLASDRAAQVGQIADNFHNQYGLGLLNLGFKAGGALALRRVAANATFGDLLAQDVNGIDFRANAVTLQSVCGSATLGGCTWDNVGLLVIMADETDDVRGWFEQVRSEHPDLQTLLLTPSEIAPQVQPYAALPNVQALAGMADAEAYFRARGITNDALGRQRDAVAIGTASFAALVVIGGFPAYLSGRRARRRGDEDIWGR